jgi:aminomethyltransferase
MKRTPLFEQHRALGARFVDFGGWQMPVQYAGIVDEHHAVRRHVGLFDVSHMGEIEVRGRSALATVQNVTVNDVSRLRDGRAQYSLMCLPSGGIIDDIIVYRLAEERLLLCVNAANTEKDLAWLREHAGGAEVVDRSPEFAQLALQGPLATDTLQPISDVPLAQLPPFAFAEGLVAGQRALLARTGYTGENGWEVYCSSANASAVWEALLTAGASAAIAPAGLGARDTLRLEAALPLYGNELNEETTPLEARLAWVVRLDKESFIGRDALLRQREAGVARRLVGFTVTDRGIARQAYRIRHGEEVVGAVTSGTKSPTLGKAIGLGYVATRWQKVGTPLGIGIRGRVVNAEVTPLPFYKRDR